MFMASLGFVLSESGFYSCTSKQNSTAPAEGSHGVATPVLGCCPQAGRQHAVSDSV